MRRAEPFVPVPRAVCGPCSRESGGCPAARWCAGAQCAGAQWANDAPTPGATTAAPAATGYSTLAKTQLATGALTASATEATLPVNPITRIGVTARVRNWDNPGLQHLHSDISGPPPPNIYSDPCSSAVSIYDVQPGQPGFLVKAENDSTDGTMYRGRYFYQPTYWDMGSAGPYGGPYAAKATCPEDLGIASSLVSDGTWESMVAGTAVSDSAYWNRQQVDSAAAAKAGRTRHSRGRKESLRSRGNFNTDLGLSGVGSGLGITWIDPRYEPGPQQMYPGAASQWAWGSAAGGPTNGAFMPAEFRPTNTQWSYYNHGLGDGQLVAPGRWQEGCQA
jgi:hypothetical protein